MGMIFISHSSRNNGEAIAIRDWLLQNGWGPTQIFLDLDAMGGGDRWRRTLDDIGNNCEAVIVCLSDDWIRSPECTREFTHAESRGKPIFPIIVAPISEQIPRFVTDIQFVDVSDPARATAGFEKLKFGLNKAQIGPDHFPWPPLSDPDRAPYRGLQALEEEDAAIFFGRNAQITSGLDALRQIRNGAPKRILTIAAASGAGKSSFLKAGLLARLRRDDQNFLVLPTWRPGRDALGGETGLLNSFGITDPDDAHTRLFATQVSVIQRLRRLGAPEAEEREPPTLVLPLDQAEELFSADNTTASAALDLLVEALAKKSDLLVVATVRTDSLAALQADARVAGQLNLFNLPSLPPLAFKEVIEGPAALAKPPIRIESALTEKLIEDLDRADALPLLAFTLERLSAEFGDDNLLELREYETGLGGVSGAISAAVEAALRRAAAEAAFPSGRSELDALVRAAFIPWLVQLDQADASPKRRVARLSEIPEASQQLVRHFVEERLLVAAESNGETTFEVSHEAVLRHWRELAAWIGEERVVLEGLYRIIRSANEWGGNEKTLAAHSPDLLVHRGERLRAAEAYLERPDLHRALLGAPTIYLKACRALEDDNAKALKAKAYFDRSGVVLDDMSTTRERASKKSGEVDYDTYGPTGVAALGEADALLEQERRFLNKVSGSAERWHPSPAQTEVTTSYNDDLHISIFPCCGLKLSLPYSPEQFRADGCCEIGTVSIDLITHHYPDLIEKLTANNDLLFEHGLRRGTGFWRTRSEANAESTLKAAQEIEQRLNEEFRFKKLRYAIYDAVDFALAIIWRTAAIGLLAGLILVLIIAVFYFVPQFIEGLPFRVVYD
jgi:TIR domain